MPIRESLGLTKDSVVRGLPVVIPPEPPPEVSDHGLLRVDHWHQSIYIDDDLIFDVPDSYFFSQPDNGFVWPARWLVDAPTAGYPSGFPFWGASPVDTVAGPIFASGFAWRPWWKNIYWPSSSDLLNAMQGSNILPFIDVFASMTIQTYTPGSGKAMRGDAITEGIATLLGVDDGEYYQSGVGTMWTALYDISTKNMGAGNAILNGMGFLVPTEGWNPWFGAFANSYTYYQQIMLPLQDGDDSIVHDWSILGGLLAVNGGPGGDYTTGPGLETTMSVDDAAFHTMKWEVTYNGHDYVDLPPGVVNPYTGI